MTNFALQPALQKAENVVCVRARAHTHASVCRGQRTVSGVIPQVMLIVHFPSYCEAESLTGLESASLVKEGLL